MAFALFRWRSGFPVNPSLVDKVADADMRGKSRRRLLYTCIFLAEESAFEMRNFAVQKAIYFLFSLGFPPTEPMSDRASFTSTTSLAKPLYHHVYSGPWPLQDRNLPASHVLSVPSMHTCLPPCTRLLTLHHCIRSFFPRFL